MAADVGSVLYGEEAVQKGIIDQVGGLSEGLAACTGRSGNGTESPEIWTEGENLHQENG